ncbi:MAG: ATP-binding protein [Chloroflexi bacterium]|nr:ATP-binding protein [Chloroflexota bacterium]
MAEQGQPSNNIERRLQDLLTYPREDLNTELKGWLDLSLDDDKANLAQAILALANSGGGYILIGFTEVEGRWVPAELRPYNLNSYRQDCINGIVKRYAEPSFHCDVYHVSHPESGCDFPIIVVPGGHRVPIRAKRDGPNQSHVRQNNYYIRRPGPVSEPPQSGQEWDDLISRCVRANREHLLEGIRDLLFGFGEVSRAPGPEEEARRGLERWIQESRARWESLVAEKLSEERPSRFSNGIWTVAYSIIGDFQPPTLEDFLDILTVVQGHETGWPPWWVPTRDEIGPYPYNGLIECWLVNTRFNDAAHSDFWRASPKGMMFLLRGYQEDCVPDQFEPGTRFDLTLPVWRVGECLLHAERLATVMLPDQSASIIFRVTWEGLSSRTLVPWANSRRFLDPVHQSRQNSVTSKILISANNISATLPEIITALTKPLYEVFDFFTPPLEMIQEELSEMRGRR